MKHALEDLHIDIMVVASAAALASQYLRRRYRLQSTYRGSDGGDGDGGGGNGGLQQGASRKSTAASLRGFSVAPAAPIAAGELQRSRRWVGRRASGRSGKGGVKTVLLSVTCIHLANKYHAGCDDPVAGFGASVKLHSVIKLGEWGGRSGGAMMKSPSGDTRVRTEGGERSDVASWPYLKHVLHIPGAAFMCHCLHLNTFGHGRFSAKTFHGGPCSHCSSGFAYDTCRTAARSGRVRAG